MFYDPKVIKYPRNKITGVPSQEDLLKIMDEVLSYRYIAICDYLIEIIRTGESIDIESLEEKYYSHPVDSDISTHYLTSYFFLSLYYYEHNLYPLKAMDYLHLAMLEKCSFDSAKALLAKFYIEGFGVNKDIDKAKQIIMKARKEIESWPYRIEIFPLSVFQIEL